MTQQHTPTPWTYWITDQNTLVIHTKGTLPHEAPRIAVIYADGAPTKTRQANAKFIIRACNAHDDLLEACKEVLGFLVTTYPYQHTVTVNRLSATITKATEEEE